MILNGINLETVRFIINTLQNLKKPNNYDWIQLTFTIILSILSITIIILISRFQNKVSKEIAKNQNKLSEENIRLGLYNLRFQTFLKIKEIILKGKNKDYDIVENIIFNTELKMQIEYLFGKEILAFIDNIICKLDKKIEEENKIFENNKPKIIQTPGKIIKNREKLESDIENLCEETIENISEKLKDYLDFSHIKQKNNL